MGRGHKGTLHILGLIFLSNPAFTFAQEAQKPGPPDTTIRVSTNRVSVGVTVEGAHSHFIRDLHREDFRIYDNGVEQELTNFLPIEEPARVVLLVESGPAALFLRPSLLQAAETFLSGISSADKVAIVSYSRSPMLEMDFTADKAEAGQALMGLNFMSGFAQQNLLLSIATTLDWLASLPGKKSIVILSTGVDDSTPNDWQLIRPKLHASDVHILAVSTAGALRKRLTNYCGRLLSRQVDMPTSQRTQKNSPTLMLKLPNLSVTSTCSNSIRLQRMGNCTLLE